MRESVASTWHGCYDNSWRGLIVDDAFAHPAKMSRGLVVRIFDYLFERGYLNRGGLVVDPFGGIGTTGIESASRGVRFIGCELEQKFASLAQRNFDLHRRTWEACGDPLPVMVQGDSRRLVELVGPVLAECVVGSPPFADGTHGTDGSFKMLRAAWNNNPKNAGKPGFRPNQVGSYSPPSAEDTYGTTPGQLGSMPPGDVADVIVSSPPYAGNDCKGGDTPAARGIGRNTREQRPCEADGKHNLTRDYGQTPGNIANLPAGNVADCVVSSPPYEGSLASPGDSNRREAVAAKPNAQSWGRNKNGTASNDNYGSSDGQLGADTGQTFWQAARTIVQQSFAILKPSGIAVWVLKDFVRNKKRVPFSDDWRKLCEACGFELVEWIHASLVKERTQDTLFGQITTKTERKSFFRRLAEKKGSPRIDHEDVLILRKP